jgi:hypothetical protein
MWALRFLAAGVVCLAVTSLSLYSQQTNSPDAPTVTFSLDFPGSEPSHYSISVRQDGHGTYESSAKTSDDSDEQLYEFEFEVSAANREHIFVLARQADFFAKPLDAGKNKMAFTGRKTLSYQDGERKSSATYNYSSIGAVQQLTDLFEGLGGTLEFGRMLAYLRRYEKLGLDDELTRMETQANSHELVDIQAVAPVLQAIFDDSSVMNVVRARALRLIEMGKAQAAGQHRSDR